MNQKLVGLVFALLMIAASCGNDDTPLDPGIVGDINCAADGGSYEYTLTGAGYTIDNPDAVTWCHPKVEGVKFIADADANTTKESRSVTYNLTAQGKKATVKVVQAPQPEVTLEREVPVVETSGGTFNLPIKSNVAFDVSIPETARDWVQVSISRTSISTVTIIVKPNDGDTARSTVITIVDKAGNVLLSITISQKGNQPRNVIYYTSTDNGKVLPSTKSTAYGPGFTIVSNTYLNGQGVITFDGDITQINGAFKNVANLKTISLPEGITHIGKMAFYYCENLEAIIIPPKVVEIGAESFQGCKKIQSISMPGSVTAIGDDAFYGCSSLLGITIPEGVISIGGGAFAHCSSLSEVTFRGNALTSIGSGCFSSCTALDRLVIPRNVKKFGSSCFRDMTGEVSLYVQDDSSIDGAFEYFKGHFNLPADNGECNKLKSICMTNNRRDMFFSGPYASEDGRSLIVNGTLYCANLCHYSEEDYTFPQGIKRVEGSAVLHQGIPNMPLGIIFSEGVEEITAKVIETDGDAGINRGRYAVRLPSTLKRMSTGIVETDKGVYENTNFSYMWTHWDIYLDAEVPPVNEMTFMCPFSTSNPPYVFYVRNEFVDAYKAAWPHLASNIKYGMWFF